MSFIDEHCIIFDNEDENRFEYSVLHAEFIDLVNRVLRERLGEVGITEEDFSEACHVGHFTCNLSKPVIEQIMCMDDFLIFKNMMTRRNIQLEMEAISALEDQQKANPECEVEGIQHQPKDENEKILRVYSKSALKADTVTSDEVQNLQDNFSSELLQSNDQPTATITPHNLLHQYVSRPLMKMGEFQTCLGGCEETGTLGKDNIAETSAMVNASCKEEEERPQNQNCVSAQDGRVTEKSGILLAAGSDHVQSTNTNSIMEDKVGSNIDTKKIIMDEVSGDKNWRFPCVATQFFSSNSCLVSFH